MNHITIGLDKADNKQFRNAKEFFSNLKQPHSVIWNDGPRMKALDKELNKKGLAPGEPGKGKNVWYCMGYVLARDEARSIALHDCDILTYDRELLARLVYPVANPLFNYEFCKGYYPRVGNNKLNGRVTIPTVKTPISLAICATRGAAPVPVPPHEFAVGTGRINPIFGMASELVLPLLVLLLPLLTALHSRCRLTTTSSQRPLRALLIHPAASVH